MKRVVIVGGGVVGVCCAYELVQRGYRVTVCDAHLGSGCSYGNGGIIVPSHFIPIASPGMVKSGFKMAMNPRSPFGLAEIPGLEMLGWIRRFLSKSTKKNVDQSSSLLKELNLVSRDTYQKLSQELGGPFGFKKNGLLMICRTDRGLQEELEVADQGRRLGLQIDPCSWDSLRDLEPAVQLAAVGGVHFRDDAHLDPAAYMAAMLSRLRELGVEFLNEDAEDGIVKDHRVVAIKTPSIELEADEFVFATGAWTQSWASKFGLRLPMLSGRGYGFTLPSEDLPLTHPAILVEARIAVTPTMNGTRFVGCLELGRPQDRGLAPRLQGMMGAIPQYFPQVTQSKLEELDIWTGHRPCTPDGLPYIGRSTRLDGAVWAAGHAMMGMSLGPITGSLVAQIVDRQTPKFPMNLLSPDRYGSKVNW